MKKIINIILTLTLLTFSFYYTNKVLNYLKTKDPLMIKIKNTKQIIKEPSDAIIKDNTIIPGISGLKIDIDKSYQRMKKINSYQESLLVYQKIKPNISLKNNQDKLIINGNSSKKEVSIILKIDNLELFNKLKEKEYFHNLNLILEKEIIKENLNLNNILILEDNIASNLKANYCYTTTINFKNICVYYNKFTIYPNFIDHDYYYHTYQIIKNGSILAYNIINFNNLEEISVLINKINNLGFKIVLLDILLEE